MYSYEVRHGSFVLVQEGKMVRDIGKEISIAFTVDNDEVIFQKHGEKELIDTWAEKFITKMRAAGFNELAEELRVVTGPFPVKEVNWLLDSTGYAATFYKKIMDGTMEKEEAV